MAGAVGRNRARDAAVRNADAFRDCATRPRIALKPVDQSADQLAHSKDLRKPFTASSNLSHCFHTDFFENRIVRIQAHSSGATTERQSKGGELAGRLDRFSDDVFRNYNLERH